MTEYSDIIASTYINPIRTVVALDDEFPTLDQVIGKNISRRAKAALQNEKALELLKYCRGRHWLVDFHNGLGGFAKRGGAQIVKKLHQTDLLVLDYKLEGENGGGGRAIEVIKELASNKHFNIVVVYTKDEVSKVFHEIALGLWQRAPFSEMPEEAIEAFFEAWRDEDAAAVRTLRDFIDIGAYRQFRNVAPVEKIDQLTDHPGLAQARTIVEQRIAAKRPEGVRLFDCLRWLIKNFEAAEIVPKLSDTGIEKVITSIPSDPNWIRGDTIFVTVVSKDLEGSKIIDRLSEALVSWRPTAQRIVISRLRAELEAKGSAVEERALKDSVLQAGMLRNLANADTDMRRSELSGLMERHWSEIFGEINVPALEDAQRMLELEMKEAKNDVKKLLTSHFRYSWYSPTDQKVQTKINLALNEYYSTKRVDGWHLSTGHIFRYEGDLWVCLSPLCDLVPGQAGSRWIGKLGDYRAFTAVRLQKADETEALNGANSNVFLFLKLDGKVECLKFAPKASDGESNPDWATFFAGKQGRFAKGSFMLPVRGILASKISDDPEKWGPLKLTSAQTVEIVAQLRYEYALNLLQRLGANLSRVGLDFTALAKK